MGHAHDSVDAARAAAVAGDGLDRGVRAGRRPHHGARGARRRRRSRRCRARSGSGCRCCSTACRASSSSTPVTSLVYGVPKLARGLPLDDEPTDEVKADQKEFFRLLYHLLVDADRGPRLPTLIVALGADRVRDAADALARAR